MKQYEQQEKVLTVKSEADIYEHAPEVWDTKTCEKASKHTARDGLGTPYGFQGYIGCHYGLRTYNGGTIRGEHWYRGEIFPLPKVAEGFRLVYRLSWGWQIVKLPS